MRNSGTSTRRPTVTTIQRGVLSWFTEHARDLPWRRTVDPWRILVSEMMLQQTQVHRVRERYEDFFLLWPTMSAFAEASLADILRFWSGLGYNKRAKNLHATARFIMRHHNGRLPRGTELLIGLPGIGTYTSAAIEAFAWNTDVVVCDTNIRRIMLRYFIGGEFADQVPTQAEMRGILLEVLPKGQSRRWYSALMDFGSAVCTGRAPKCADCPLMRSCAASAFFRSGDTRNRRRLVRGQSRFEGSRRQVRGAVIRMLVSAGSGGMKASEFADRFDGWDIDAILGGLVVEGLVEEHGDGFRLPE